jgi:hypothetical protein
MNSLYYDKRNALLSQVEGSLNRYKDSIWALTRHYNLAIAALEKLSEGSDLPEPLREVVALIQAKQSAWKEYGARFQELDDWEN